MTKENYTIYYIQYVYKRKLKKRFSKDIYSYVLYSIELSKFMLYLVFY